MASGTHFSRKALLPGAAALYAAIIMIFRLTCPEPVSSQDWGQELRGAGRRVLDYQFDRADREISPDRWMEEARRGISSAMAVWEEIAHGSGPGMVPDSTLSEMARWSEEELEKRFTRWLMERFFGAGIELGSSAVLRGTNEADKYYIYYTGYEGNILYDPATGDPLIIRPGDEGHDFAEDLSSWRRHTSETAAREIQIYRERVVEDYPELLAYIAPDRREGFSPRLAGAGENSVRRLNSEFEALLAREERYFSAQRLGDIYSWRKRSEDDSAAAIGDRLIAEARQVCDDGIASIEAKIEAARTDGVDFILAGNQWLDEYREQFSRGIMAWEAAEERFLVRRIEWEQSAEKAFNDGWEAWYSVFARFDEERRLWEEKARELFLEGENFFAHASGTLEAAIASARLEYEKESGIRIAAAYDRAEAMAGMLVLSSAAALEAEKNIEFWAERYRLVCSGPAIPPSYDEMESWAGMELQKQAGPDREFERLILNELIAWLGLYRNYQAKIAEARECFAGELFSLSGSAGGILDFYDLELLRLQGELEYWESRAVLSEAVVAYAEALDAGRITASESAEAWEWARIAYNEAAARYGEAESALRAGSDGIASARDALADTARKMREAEDALERLRVNYQNLINTFGARGIESIRSELVFLRASLASEQELLWSLGDGSPWGKFLDCARELEARQYDEIRRSFLQVLISGDGDSVEPLAALAMGTGPESPDQLNLRLAAISLLIEGNSTSDWYNRFGLDCNPAEHDAGNFPVSTEEKLLYDWEMSLLAHLRERSELELAVLDFLEGNEADDAIAQLAYLYTGDEAAMAADREILDEILNLITYLQKVTNTYGPGYLQESLAQASLANHDILRFLTGRSQIFQDDTTIAISSDSYRREGYSRALYDVYAQMGDLSPAVALEKAERSLLQLGLLWEALGIDAKGALIPDAEKITEAMIALDGGLGGIPQLFFVLDEIFASVPSWLSLNYLMWKESLSSYCASQSDGELDQSQKYSALLNELLFSLSDSMGSGSDIFDIASLYLQNPLLEWNDSHFSGEINSGIGEYNYSLDALFAHISKEAYLTEEIGRLALLLELAENGQDQLSAEAEQLLAAIAHAEEISDSSFAAYRNAENNFINAGAYYDALYDNAERAFKNLEEARRALETQDALKQWAETAYLDPGRPYEELRYSLDRAERVRNTLNLLVSIKPDGSLPGEYSAALEEYQKSLELYALSLDALNKVELAIAAEHERNFSAYRSYQEQLSLFGKVIPLDDMGISPDDKSLWTILDIITVEDGRLVFARDDRNGLIGSDEDRLELLAEYFAQNIYLEGETNPVSSFELALRELAMSFNASSFGKNDYINLGLARDYFVRTLLSDNSELSKIQNWYRVSAELKENQNLGERMIPGKGKGTAVYETANDALKLIENSYQPQAWNRLSDEEKKNLEFYTILTRLGSGDSNGDPFSQVTESQQLNRVYEYVFGMYLLLDGLQGSGMTFFSSAKNDFKIIKNIKDSLTPTMNEVNRQVSDGFTELRETLLSMDSKLNAYTESSQKLSLLYGGENGFPGWGGIEIALGLAGGIDGNLGLLMDFWEALDYIDITAAPDIPGALRELARLCAELKDANAALLSQAWVRLESERGLSEIAYRELYNAYLSGNADLNEIREIALPGFSGVSAGAHLANIGNSLAWTMDELLARGLGQSSEYSVLAAEFSGLIGMAWEEKLAAGLKARENEWALQMADIGEKLAQWRESAELILENGRLAWKDGEAKIRDACDSWARAFREEHEIISGQWTAAFLEGLYDKEVWAASALAAFNQGASAALIAMVGSGAEAGARAMDTRDPISWLSSGLPDAREGEMILAGLLERAGTGYLSSSFASIAGAGIPAAVRTGIGGAWASGAVLAEASALARTIRDDFEARESGKMAYSVMATARDAYKMLEDNLRHANLEIKKNMDETFIVGGQWQRSGSGYYKDVVVHSTFFNSVISESARVDGYRYYALPQSSLSGYMYGDLPSNISAFQAEEMIDAIFAEINGLGTIVFGSEAEGITGEFFVHLGDAPTPRKSPDPEDGRHGVLEDFGSGESGRLLTEFYFWMCKEGLGISMMNQPPWDKPLWDDRDSAISAPSLRSAIDFAIQTGLMIAGAVGSVFTGGMSLVGSIALNAALNSADDLIFMALDASYGYKSWGEAGVEFGKAAARNTINSAAGAFFNGAKNLTSLEPTSFFARGGFSGLVSGNGFGSMAFRTFSAGLQSATTGIANSAISSINYSASGGFSFSGDAFADSVKNSLKYSLPNMTATFTNSILSKGMFGFTDSLFKDGSSLNSLVGGLASQGVNYALGGDFTLNLLNAGLFSTNSNVNAGLVELHLGRNGTSFQMGGGGANLSPEAFWSAMKGFEAWGVNAEIFFSSEEATSKYTKELRVLYSEKGTTRDEYKNVLAGKTKYVEDPSQEGTQSVYDKTTGVKTVILGANALNSTGVFDLGVYFSHESYRDGIIGTRDEQIAETEMAWLGHSKTANAIIDTYGYGSLGVAMLIEAAAYKQAMETGNFTVMNNILDWYDSSADYWMLTAEGKLANDGLATLRDSKGNIIRTAESMGVTETMIEGSLVEILGFSRSDPNAVALVRDLMVNSGLTHSYSDDPDQWFWIGTHDINFSYSNTQFILENVDLKMANMGKTINLSDISQMYSMYSAYGDPAMAMNSFINNTYGSAIGFLKYSNTFVSRDMLKVAYNPDQYQMIVNNYTVYDQLLKYGINVERYISGNPQRTFEFEQILGIERITDTSDPNVYFFDELHNGLDFVASIDALLKLPGGYWSLIGNEGHTLIYELYGTDLKVRYQHLDPDTLNGTSKGTIYEGLNLNLPYPTGVNGAGTDTHVHFDATMRLPYDGRYERQFVNPATLQPGNQLEYWFVKYDINKVPLPKYPDKYKIY